MSTDLHEHWETVWRERAPDELSWHQHSAEQSFALVTASLARPDAAIIDVGGGDSPLAGELLRYGFGDLTVLDISQAALEQGRRRLGVFADAVSWVAADVTTYQPDRAYQLWHDRAVFHFLTDPVDQRAYVRTAAAALAPGGWVIVATFALDGPKECSGLPVCRHSPESLTDIFSAQFEPIDCTDEQHTTPRGTAQSFLYARYRRR